MSTQPLDPRVAYLAGALGQAIKEAGFQRWALEQRMGLSRGYLSRILKGAVELRAEHIFDILEALGIEPWKFFQAAYPAIPGAVEDPWVEGVREYAENSRGALQGSDADLERRVREAMARILLGERR